MAGRLLFHDREVIERARREGLSYRQIGRSLGCNASSVQRDVETGLAALRRAAADMIDGLVNAEGSEPRIQALQALTAAADEIKNALVAAREAAVDPTA